jgi:aspartyl aminopeptidase
MDRQTNEKNNTEEYILAEELLGWIAQSPTAFHVVKNVSEALKEIGVQLLSEQEEWHILPGRAYAVTRGGSSLIAFYVPEGADHFQLMAAHSDSPAFRVKEQGAMTVEGHYVKLNTEGYGGMIDSSWFDRPLSLAGRLMVEEEDGVKSLLYDAGRDLCLIPNLAIHMNREINSGYKYNHQKDLLPLLGMVGEQTDLYSILMERDITKPEQIVAADLCLYNRQPGCIWGARQEFISAPRLDDLECVFAGMKAFEAAWKQEQQVNRQAGERSAIPVLCIFDNEEVGSQTKQGAASTFLADTLERIGEALGKTSGAVKQMIAKSFLISADNAHALHPNHTEKTDPTNRPVLNGGLVIKYNSSQRYTTDAFSGAVMKQICKKAGVPFQTFFNRSDMPGGSTLGNISTSQVSLHSVDIGLAQLAMHSAYETAGVQDIAGLVQALTAFYGQDIQIFEDGFQII